MHGCGKSEDDTPHDFPRLPSAMKAQYCPPATVTDTIPERQFLGQRLGGSHTYEELRDAVNSSCKDCHQAPAQSKGVTYIDSYQGEERTIDGVTKIYPGLADMAEKFAAAIAAPDNGDQKQMPPPERRNNNPAGFLRVGKMLEAWIAAGKPQGPFSMASDGGGDSAPPTAPLVFSSQLGDCVPRPEAIGFDYRRDRMFANATELPKDLIDTDLPSLNAFDLAQRGTVAYNVEYPLWADNAEKGRWVHVPMLEQGNTLVRQQITYDANSKTFKIPENTRFYKTFYKLVKDEHGKQRYRRIETRLIVVRYAPNAPLFGTYRWDESEQSATLVDTPYRDGTPWKDVVFNVVTDVKKGTERKYAIPARHRCQECHQGSDTHSFVLGFTPLQINRRSGSEYARNPHPMPDELTLAERLSAYGIVSGYVRAEELPRLEWMGTAPPHNIFEFKANAYMVGNCAHCHNPDGFAKQNGIDLTLTPAAIFNFNVHQKSQNNRTRYIVNNEGDVDRSVIYNKIADPPSQQGILSRMPMHTPALPDCTALTAIGKWIRSFESIDAANGWEPDCKAAGNDWDFVPQDFTWPKSDHYVPRRSDWADPVAGMPQKFRDLEYTPDLKNLLTSQYAVGYWNEKDECSFPKVASLPPEKVRPWMVDGTGKPKDDEYGFGKVYSTTPGSWFFRTNCIKCHGPQANGDTALARGILNWSGGDVRVADLIDGLFGNKLANQSLFDVSGKNLAGNYLIWMAMEGTRVKFPPEASNFIGKHGAQMLNGIRDSCLRQINPETLATPIQYEYEIYHQVCFFNNLSPGDEKLKFDPDTLQPLHPDDVETWLDRAAYNAGWAIFQYLEDAGSGNWRPGNDECEKVYPRGGNPR